MTEHERKERGEPATFDRQTGEVHGSGSGAGGEGNPGEDHDADPMGGGGADPMGAPPVTRKGHPLPRSDEARHNEIPEHVARDKGRGDDARAVIQPGEEAAAPDGETYAYADLGRGPDTEQEGE